MSDLEPDRGANWIGHVLGTKSVELAKVDPACELQEYWCAIDTGIESACYGRGPRVESAFDVPVGLQPAGVELHDSTFSGGACCQAEQACLQLVRLVSPQPVRRIHDSQLRHIASLRQTGCGRAAFTE